MTTFTIDSENNITAYSTQAEITHNHAEQFATEKELAQLAASWPGARLVDIWNGIPGLTPVQKFTNRKVAIARLWKAVQSLGAAPQGANVASRKRRVAAKATRKQRAHTGRQDSKQGKLSRCSSAPAGQR